MRIVGIPEAVEAYEPGGCAVQYATVAFSNVAPWFLWIPQADFLGETKQKNKGGLPTITCWQTTLTWFWPG